jgi:hypothetical protein
MAEYFGFSGRTATAAATFFLLSKAARLDASNNSSQSSLLTPRVVTAAHKLVDDMLNDALRGALMGAEKHMSQEQKREVGQVMRLSLTSGTPAKISKINRFLDLYGLSLDKDLVLNLKRLCDLRDAVFHDDAPARSQPGYLEGRCPADRHVSLLCRRSSNRRPVLPVGRAGGMVRAGRPPALPRLSCSAYHVCLQ